MKVDMKAPAHNSPSHTLVYPALMPAQRHPNRLHGDDGGDRGGDDARGDVRDDAHAHAHGPRLPKQNQWEPRPGA
jgi:hypothetical protein